MSDIPEDTQPTISTAIENGTLNAFLDDEWQPVGPVDIHEYGNGTRVSVPDPESPEGKEVISFLDQVPYFRKIGEGVFFLRKPDEDQSDPTNDHANDAVPEENKENN